ncbi:MAG: hypothetical protein RRY39_05095 [Odoribacter sp.]
MAFCVFAFLVGMRLKQRISGWKKSKAEIKINKNQRSKIANAEESSEENKSLQRRKKRVRIFTIIQLFVLGGLMIYMIPALVKDFMLPGRVDAMNIFLRCLIFVFTIYIFILGYLKVFRQKDKDNM